MGVWGGVGRTEGRQVFGLERLLLMLPGFLKMRSGCLHLVFLERSMRDLLETNHFGFFVRRDLSNFANKKLRRNRPPAARAHQKLLEIFVTKFYLGRVSLDPTANNRDLQHPLPLCSRLRNYVPPAAIRHRQGHQESPQGSAVAAHATRPQTTISAGWISTLTVVAVVAAEEARYHHQHRCAAPLATPRWMTSVAAEGHLFRSGCRRPRLFCATRPSTCAKMHETVCSTFGWVSPVAVA